VSIILVDTKFASGGARAGFLMLRSLAATVASQIVAVASCDSNAVSQPNPFGDMLIALKRRQFRTIQVLGYFHHARARRVYIDKRTLDLIYAEALACLDTMTAGDEHIL
jgi:hypothetical protein